MCSRGQKCPRGLHLCLEYKLNQIFFYTRCNTPERVTSWRAHLRLIAPGQQSSF